MRRLYTIFFLVLLTLSLGACQFAREREAHRSQALLNEADLLISTRELGKAADLCQDALDKLAPLLTEQPDHLDFQLLQIRALITKFIAQNVLVMEDAKIRPRSLVRLPDPTLYVDYNNTIPEAENRLLMVTGRIGELTDEQAAFVHGMLAAIYRLKDDTLDKAVLEYDKAVARYDLQLAEAVKDRKANKNKIEQFESKIRSLRMAQAEVLLLGEDWNEALEQLKTAMAGGDLKYFDLHFDLLENTIKDIEEAIAAEQARDRGSREAKLRAALEKKKQKAYSKREQLGGYNPYQVALIKNRIELGDTQNNLIYRMICYYQLGQNKDYQKAREILTKHYPELSTELDSKLRQYR